MADAHNLTPGPPPDRYGLPGTFYPTHNRAEFVVVIEELPLEQNRLPLAPYTAHPSTGGSTGNAEAVLTAWGPTKGDGTRKNVRLTYETLPGPWLNEIRRDNALGFVQVRRRAVRSIPAAYGTISATGRTVYQSRDGSPLVSWEIVERWSNGTGTPGGDGFPNAVYPQRTDDPTDDEEKGPIKTVRQAVASDGSEPASTTYSSGVVTEITYQYISPGLRDKITTTYSLPGPLRTYKVLDTLTNSMVEETRQLVYAGTADPTITDYFTDFQRVPVYAGVVDRFIIRQYPTSIVDPARPPIEEFKPTRFTYPAIQHGLSGTITGIEFLGAFYLESERPLNTNEKHSTIFTTTAPNETSVEAGLVNFLPIRVHFATSDNSVTYNSPVPVLIDEFDVLGETSMASTPDATTYIAARFAGNWFAVARPSKKLSGPSPSAGVWAVTTISMPYK